ncbi:hypothetical protein DFJ58DRAFT_723118 [Suillus subalutaceus]|uniref:uncharacterized protein n=1 Tax=Suillus subalutaceus TaxID=48586 RepID=UPI001B886A7A|nr:uncharacterized protein DFJ58DRAFT_723118 [Suillus subalutaceus]KAG1870221.1 hypothetical protein DFJ58DRAFT_723118 [Suillus subalutaceus]
MRCPSCSKRFKNEGRFLQHLNQPSSHCYKWDGNLVRILRPAQAPSPQFPLHNDTDPTFDPEYMDHGVDADTGAEYGSSGSQADYGEEVEFYDGAGKTWGVGKTFMDQFNEDEYAAEREQNQYFPFASKPDWEMASYILRSDLSMAEIDKYLNLEFTKTLPLSFRSSRELRGRVELLPAPPQWKYQKITTEFPTTKTLQIFYRDAIECLQSLLSHPLLAASFDFIPCKVYESAERAVRVYHGFMTGDHAWNLQKDLPEGASLLGVVLSSDKTKVSNIAGNRYVHPLLVSLANIDPGVRAKGSLHAYIPLALLPVAKFLHRNKRMHGVLADRLLHQCIDLVVEPLKQAARLGVMMSDPRGFSRYCFTPLVAYVADTPEELVIACATMNSSPVTMATREDFGDPIRHPPRDGSSTLANIAAIITSISPSDLIPFFEACKRYNLNGVDLPFWRNWLTANPSSFLTPELLHHLHKMFWDHDRLWCTTVVCTGYRAFKEGISALKQATGRDHRNVQRYIVGVIAGAAPADFISAIRALMEFRYLAQAPHFTDKQVVDLDRCLKVFHRFKQSIVDAGARRGKGGGDKPWAIPKLELLQGVVPSICSHGAVMQWSADPTEHAHIKVVKEPARAGNNHDYDAQVCRHLDRRDKVERFDLALQMRAQEDHERDEDNEGGLVQHFVKDYFACARDLINGVHPQAPRPYRTFSTSINAYHLSYDPTHTKMTVDKAAENFSLPDLRPAVSDYLDQVDAHVDHFAVGGRRHAHPGCPLPFERIQLEPAQTLHAQPPSSAWPYGRYDSVIVSSGNTHKWPKSGLDGHFVAHLRLIFRPITTLSYSESYLAYVERLDVVTLDDSTGMYILRRARRANNDRIGDVIPITQIVAPVHLIPRFGPKADPRLTMQSSINHATEFYLNKFWNKELFFALHVTSR